MKRIYKILISSILILVSYGFIFFKIKNFIATNNAAQQFELITFNHILLLVVTFILMPINWFLESIKWHILIKYIQELSLWQSFKAVISGITIGIATPNRIGEIGGRILFVEKGKKSYAAIITGIGSFAQFLVTLIMGFLSLLLFTLNNKSTESILFHNITLFAILTLIVFTAWLYYNPNLYHKILINIPFIRDKVNQLNQVQGISKNDLLKVTLLSLFRFFVFSTQFYILLLFFKVDISYPNAFASICLIYLFSTIIPTTTIAELGIRSSFSIYFLGLYTENILGVIFVSFTLWIINLAVPAIIGPFFLFRNKFN